MKRKVSLSDRCLSVFDRIKKGKKKKNLTTFPLQVDPRVVAHERHVPVVTPFCVLDAWFTVAEFLNDTRITVCRFVSPRAPYSTRPLEKFDFSPPFLSN